MTKRNALHTSFLTGYLDENFDMRAETVAYNNSMFEARNVRLLNGGGWRRRGGSDFLADVAEDGRLRRFAFDSDELYIVCFIASGAKIYSVNGTLLQTIAGAPWSLAQAREMNVAQLADTMVITHGDFWPRVLMRTSISTFTLSLFVFDEDISGNFIKQPYARYAAPDITLSFNATTGTNVTCIASDDVFSSSWVGLRLRWFDTEVLITGYVSPTEVAVTIYGKLKGRYLDDPLRTTDGENIVEVTHALHGMETGEAITIDGADSVGGISGASLNGTRTITVVDENHYTFVAGGTADTSDNGGGPSVTFEGANIASRRWDEQAFSNIRGYPRCVCFMGGRLWLAGTASDPGGIWASHLRGRYFNFDVGDAFDDEAISLAIGTQTEAGSTQIAEIVHLVPDRDLNIYTMDGEYYAPVPFDSTLTPTNFRVLYQTPYGSGDAVPANFDGATLFHQRGTPSIREFLFVDVSASYQAPSISFLCPSLITGPREIVAFHGGGSIPEQYAFVLNDDGTMAVMISSRSEKLTGWTWFDVDHPSGTAAIKSIVEVNDTIFMLVNRGSDYFLEKLHLEDDLTIDCAKTYTNGSPQSTWTVDDQYDSQTVDVMSGNLYLGSFAVGVAGALNLGDISVSSITVGYSYEMEVDTPPPRVEGRDGTIIGLARRIVDASVQFKDTISCKVNGQHVISRLGGDDFSQEPTPINGKRQMTFFGYKKDPKLEFRQIAPVKCGVNGATLRVKI